MEKNIKFKNEVNLNEFGLLTLKQSGSLFTEPSYDEVCEIFGEPKTFKPEFGESRIRWIGTINGQVFTITNGNKQGDIKNSTYWLINGEHRRIAELVNVYMELATIEKEMRLKK